MKTNYLLILGIFMMLMQGCKQEKTNDNPFFAEFNTPFQVPPFDRIDSTHYLPAFIEGMKEQMTEIEAIVDNPAPADFDNTILAFDKSGKMLTRTGNVFYNMTEANTNDQMQEIARKLSPLMSKHRDDISMNKKLFERIRQVYENRLTAGLDSQQIRVVEKYYQDFVRRGASLSPEKQDQLRKINEELSLLTISFGENLLAETNKNYRLVIGDSAELAGLPAGVVAAAAETAKEDSMAGKWVFTLAKPSLIPFIQYSSNRPLREQIYKAYYTRGDHGDKFDNKEIVKKIVNLRVEKARLLGYDNFAAYVIDENMAKKPEAVNDFLKRLWDAALPVSKKEVAAMQKIIDREGGTFKLATWDWWYYAEKLRKEQYDLDENELKPYFSVDNVRNGMFMVAEKLYGITFSQRKDLPVYNPDVEVFEVKEANGDHLGVLYLDYFPRASKRGGAWCTEFLTAGWENGKRVAPVVSIVCNFTKPTADTPSLLSWDETTTLFHEFGHALHSLFTEGKYARTAGVVPRDYVELPSQIMENWAAEPVVLKDYAKHYKTGEPIPQSLIDKINRSGHFNQGFATVEYLAASILDMDYHTQQEVSDMDVNTFEKNAMDRIGLIGEIIPRYRSTYFAHIFDGGYAAGYYVYIWAAVLDADAFTAFKESGYVYNRELALKFRKYCLAEVGSGEGMDQYLKFRGKQPAIEPLLERRGLK